MTKKELIKQLKQDGYLKTSIIIEAFKEIDRVDFLPKDMQSVAYSNQALPIGREQTISQPLTVAFLLEKLKPKTGEKILDVGTGSGWQAALLAYIISKNDKDNKGKIISIERIPELREEAEENIDKYDFIKNGVVETFIGDGSKGFDKYAPYDKIIAAASAKKLPEAWKRQVKIGGKIVAPIGNSIYSFKKIAKDDFVKKQHFGFSFVPLVQSE